jgi:hypothetical protein
MTESYFDIYGLAEVVAELELSKQTVDALRHGSPKQAADPAFPAPAVTLACGPIWRGAEIRAYKASRKDRRFKVVDS